MYKYIIIGLRHSTHTLTHTHNTHTQHIGRHKDTLGFSQTSYCPTALLFVFRTVCGVFGVFGVFGVSGVFGCSSYFDTFARPNIYAD